MDFKLSQQLSQKLVLSPQIQQYLKLLQLPLVELNQNIDQELMENPVLELEEKEDEVTTTESEEVSEDNQEALDKDELDFKETFDLIEKLDDSFQDGLYSRASDGKGESIEDLEKRQNYRETLITKETTLSEYIEWQLAYFDLSEDHKKVALELIGSLNEDGYFTGNLIEFSRIFEIPLEVLEDIFTLLQGLDPAGIFGRDLREVLMLQIERKEATEVNRLAYKILDEFFHYFEKREIEAIVKELKLKPEQVERAIKLITQSEPKPGRIYYKADNVNVIPDVAISISDDDENELIIEINDESVPSLRVSQYYRKLIKDKNVDVKTKEYIKQKINAGIWFIKAIEQRKSTLRQITEQIVIVQKEFFTKGFAFLKPLTLKDIAEEINLHESTVSRALSGKYVATPQGTISFKSFFSNKMSSFDGVDESQKSVMEKLKQIISNEDPKKPLSDSKIVDIMEEKGIKIARRTVAKYREMLKILPSHLRKVK